MNPQETNEVVEWAKRAGWDNVKQRFDGSIVATKYLSCEFEDCPKNRDGKCCAPSEISMNAAGACKIAIMVRDEDMKDICGEVEPGEQINGEDT